MKNTFRILEISFGRPIWDNSFRFTLDGTEFDVQRAGAHFSISAMKQIIGKLKSDIDAIAVNHLPPRMKLNHRTYFHPHYLEIMNLPAPVPIRDGTYLRELANLMSLSELIQKGEIHPQKGFFFPSALLNLEIEEYLRKEHQAPLKIGDLYGLLGIPVVLDPFKGLARLAGLGIAGISLKNLGAPTQITQKNLRPFTQALFSSQVENSQYVVGDLSLLLLLAESVNFLRDKDVITTSYNEVQMKALSVFGPRSIRTLIPKKFQIGSTMNYPVLDAALSLIGKKKTAYNLKEWENILNIDTDLRQVIRRHVVTNNDSMQSKLSKGIYKFRTSMMQSREPDFAFVIHALSHKDFEHIPVLGPAVKFLPSSWNDSFDKMASKFPSYIYGQINNIISKANGREVNGIIYAMPATPKVLKGEDPEKVYRALERICYDAANRGAKIVGLGAYTKMVGDSGLTVSQLSPIPVTTGNSLSAAATLWGLRDTLLKMKLVKTTGPLQRVDGTAMVIGATGSIGSVSAKLLSLAFNKLYLVAPRIDRLIELKNEIEVMSPLCEVIVSQDPNGMAANVDALVTATSAFNEKIIDVMKLKPGCVVCDCSRPSDFNLEDALKRPDILIIESGEVLLPGPVEIKGDLGLPGKAVYACLAETALLAMEGRYESFTMGREIDWNKVKEIYRIARYHGIELAGTYGHLGAITDTEIELIRQLVLSKKKNYGPT